MSQKKVVPLQKPASAPRPGPGSGRAPTRAGIEHMARAVRDLVMKDPRKAATILTDWMNRPRAASPAPRKKAG